MQLGFPLALASLFGLSAYAAEPSLAYAPPANGDYASFLRTPHGSDRAALAAQAVGYVPPGVAAYVSSDNVTWTPLTTAGTGQAISGASTPPAVALYQYSTTQNAWIPWSLPGSLTTYTGLVGTHNDLPNSFIASGLQQYMMRDFSFARAAIPANSAMPVMANAYVTSANLEVAIPGTSTYTMSIEYPAGNVLGHCTFAGGATSKSVTGAVLVIPSSCPHVAIPEGAMFWKLVFYNNPSGIPFIQSTNNAFFNAAYEQFNFGASVPDETLVGGNSVTPLVAGYGLHATAVIGPTIAPSLCIVGDSREYGSTQAITDITGDTGDVTKIMGHVFNYAKLAMSGTSAYNFLPNDTLRLQIGQWCTHVFDNYGVNDATSGQNISQIIANRSAIAAAFGKPTYGTTVYSRTSSTDSWATLANQTVVTGLVGPGSLSAAILAGVPGEVDEVDEAGAGDPTSTGKFPVSPNVYASTGTANFGTSDGTHKSGAESAADAQRLGYTTQWIHR